MLLAVTGLRAAPHVPLDGALGRLFRSIRRSATTSLDGALSKLHSALDPAGVGQEQGARSGATSSAGGFGDGLLGSTSRSHVTKELLRIVTSRVAGSMVPDQAINTFMQVYQQLHAPLERLRFFQLVIADLGLSVGEVTAAVRQWEASAARASASAPAAVPFTAADAGVEPPAAPPCSPPPPPARPPLASAPAPPAPSFHEGLYRAADRLSSAARPLYTQLFLPISQTPNGMKFLVDLRADLLQLVVEQQQPAAAAPLRAMADHIRQSLAEWFSVGLLQLQAISWEGSTAELLEKVMRYEAVHPIAGWAALRQRLGPRRRVYAFFHPSMPREPLVVLHTALMQEAASDLPSILPPAADGCHHEHDTPPPPPQQQQLIAARAPAVGAPPGESSTSGEQAASTSGRHQQGSGLPPPPTTAVFYSISSTQKGLAGVDLGQFLIKRVAERIMAEQPSVTELVTLSPLPNYRAWLTSRLQLVQQQQQDPRQGQGQAPPSAAGTSRSRTVAGGATASVPPPEAALLSDGEVLNILALAAKMGWGGGAAAAGGRSASHAAAHAAASASTSGHSSSEHPQLQDEGQWRHQLACRALAWLLEGDRWLSDRPNGRSPGSCRQGGSESSSSSNDSGGSGNDNAGGTRVLHSGLESAAAEVLRPVLLRLAARYLALERRRRLALCPVAHFHLRNGASLWRLNWGADMSSLGLARSFGLMVNYKYELGAVQDNNSRYLMAHELQVHAQVQELLSGGTAGASS